VKSRFAIGIVLGVLALIVGAVVFHCSQRGNLTETINITTRAYMDRMAVGTRAFRQEYGRWPESLNELLPEGNSRRTSFVEEGTLCDTWGLPFNYSSPDDVAGVGGEIMSFGADRKQGGSGAAADLRVAIDPIVDSAPDFLPPRTPSQ
jgi:hypothetical protein